MSRFRITCERGLGNMLTRVCSARWREANSKENAGRQVTGSRECNGCPNGAARAGRDAISEPSSALSRVKACTGCGDDFAPRHGNRIRCDRCRHGEKLPPREEAVPAVEIAAALPAPLMVGITRNCRGCHKEFRAKNHMTWYCKNPCTAYEAQQGRAATAYRERKPSVELDKTRPPVFIAPSDAAPSEALEHESQEISDLGRDLVLLVRKHGLTTGTALVLSRDSGHIVEIRNDLPVTVRLRNPANLKIELLRE